MFRTRKVNLVQTYSLSGSFTKALQDATEHDCPNMVFEEQVILIRLVIFYCTPIGMPYDCRHITEKTISNVKLYLQWEDEAWATLVAYVQQHLVKGKLKSEYAAIQTASVSVLKIDFLFF